MKEFLLENEIINQEELLGAIDRILIKSSIAVRCSDHQPLSYPVGKISGARYDSAQDKLIIETAQVEAVSRTIKTDFTLESLQDLKSIYKESFVDILAYYLVDSFVYKLDADYLTMIKTRAKAGANLVFDASYDANTYSLAQSILININKELANLPISDNRSPNSFAIVNSNVASILSVLPSFSTDDTSPSFLGNFAGLEVYVDYTNDNSGTDAVICGIKGNGISKGSTIYSPYNRVWIKTNDYKDGEPLLFMVDRTALSINPLDNEYLALGTSGFLSKFNVDVSALQIFQ